MTAPARHRDAAETDAMLDALQRESFGYFVHEADESTGLVI
jgi:hypothetical protein